MTKEKAIEILNALAWVQGGADREETITAISMAIEALLADTVSREWYETDFCKYGERQCNYFGERREP